MPGEDEIDPSTYKERVAKTPVFGMMAKKDLISLLPFEFGEPVRARHDLIMIPKIRKLRIKHSGSVSLKAAYIPEGRRKTTDDNTFSLCPGIVQHSCTGGSEKPKLIIGQHPFMISDGNIGGRDCSASPKKRKNELLTFHPVPGFLRGMAGDQVTGDRDQIRVILFHAPKCASPADVVEVGDQGDFHFLFV